MPKLTINQQEIEVPQGSTVLQACEEAGVEIPRFCYHERLSVAGNCRMCLVEMERAPKPIASCAMPVVEGMVIRTNTPLVEKARNGVMEFLLANHPLDCPICDQGGECDLQDQAMAYGYDRSRYKENKRAVKDKELGPLVKTIMTRCIHCTRCVRFATEVAGVEELGAVGRGESMEIGTYVEKTLSSELSGNIVDLCPVGALTSKPYAFTARSWELQKTETIDVLDAVGSHIRIDSRGAEVMRIVPRICEEINEEWISDKTRYSYDGLKYQRLDRPYVRKKGKLVAVDWDEALDFVASKLNKTDADKVGAIVGDLADCEAMVALKDFITDLGSTHIDCRQESSFISTQNRSDYLMNTPIADLEEADYCLIIGANPRLEAPLINTRLRKNWLDKGLKVSAIGSEYDMTYPVEWLGDRPEILSEILEGSHQVAKGLKKAKKPVILLGMEALSRGDGEAIYKTCRLIADKYKFVMDSWNGFNILHRSASRVGGLDLDFVPQKKGMSTSKMLKAAEKKDLDVLYLLGADEIDFSKLKSCFVIYQGHHGDAGAHHADVIFPSLAYTEKNATYVNCEGRVQKTVRAVKGPGMAKEDWKIIRALSERVGKVLNYNTLEDVRARLEDVNPVFKTRDEIIRSEWKKDKYSSAGKINSSGLKNPIEDFYRTNPISRASKIMAECSNSFKK